MCVEYGEVSAEVVLGVYVSSVGDEGVRDVTGSVACVS